MQGPIETGGGFLCVAGWLSTALALVACDGAKPVAPAATSTAAARSATSGVTAPAPSASAATSAPGASVSATPSAAPSAAPAALDLAHHPELFGEDKQPLPQTEDRPSTESPAFKRRMELLWQAITTDDPSVAEGVFFPSVAYEQVKDIENAKADWKSRLMKAFSRNVHEYHKQLGEEPGKAVLLGVDVDEGRVKWMKRGSEGNKLGYFRVTRSKIRYRDAAGNEKKLELTSLISWRGEWFVVHLHGFK